MENNKFKAYTPKKVVDVYVKGVQEHLIRTEGAHNYNSLTLDGLEKAMRDIQTRTEKNSFTVITGAAGMELYNLATYIFPEGLYNLPTKYHYNTEKRIKGIYLSLFSKHGNYKLLIKNPSEAFRYVFYKGTQVITESTDLSPIKRLQLLHEQEEKEANERIAARKAGMVWNMY